ncbi:MAG: hypothetical protein U0176_09175 [Bacteroidia bacterium]
MATPIALKTGTAAVLNFSKVDNMVSVELNPDGLANGKMGWVRMFEMNAAGFGNSSPVSVDLTSALTNYKNAGCTTVTLCIVLSNWGGPGNCVGGLNWTGGSQAISVTNVAPYTSTQLCYVLTL